MTDKLTVSTIASRIETFEEYKKKTGSDSSLPSSGDLKAFVKFIKWKREKVFTNAHQALSVDKVEVRPVPEVETRRNCLIWLCPGHFPACSCELGGFDKLAFGSSIFGRSLSPDQEHQQPWRLLCVSDCVRHGRDWPAKVQV